MDDPLWFFYHKSSTALINDHCIVLRHVHSVPIELMPERERERERVRERYNRSLFFLFYYFILLIKNKVHQKVWLHHLSYYIIYHILSQYCNQSKYLIGYKNIISGILRMNLISKRSPHRPIRSGLCAFLMNKAVVWCGMPLLCGTTHLITPTYTAPYHCTTA